VIRKLFVLLLIAATASANETSFRSLQSGPKGVATPLSDRGLNGAGQIIAVLDTGVDYDSCFFAEADGSKPPVNTGTPNAGLAWGNVNLGRRKIIAYNFLFSCDQYPNAQGCENPNNPNAYDNTGHGTHNAATLAGDAARIGQHDFQDALASGAKLVVQDAGFIGGDNCSQRPGIGCPVNLTPILDQAYKQGARIHSNSWGDRQNTSPFLPTPTANYSISARDLDAFVYAHPDMLVVFNTGNYGATSDIPPNAPPPMSVAAPGTAKNALQVGGVRPPYRDDDVISYNTLFGPTRDGRIKPDVVGPSTVTAGDYDFGQNNANCNYSSVGPGTSWASPTVAGAAALVRQYYTEGFYPSGARKTADALAPSAALLKATIIASARQVSSRMTNLGDVAAKPVPSNEQGFGFPALDDALYFDGDRAKLRVSDVANAQGLAEGESVTVSVNAASGTPLKFVLVWTDPPGVVRGVSDPTPELVNDLDIRVVTPSGAVLYPNGGAQPDRLNNVEAIAVAQPVTGAYSVTIRANRIGSGVRQGYALVMTGDFLNAAPGRARAVRAR
jgi:Subtilase family